MTAIVATIAGILFLSPSPPTTLQRDYETRLVPVGKPAPDFTLKTADGKNVKLSSVWKKNKATIINFWFYHWGACREELPHIQKIYNEGKSSKLAVIAVNNGDDNDTIKNYWKQNKFTFTAVKGTEKLFDSYGVLAYPTNYIVDSKGNVVWRSVGFDEQGMRSALKKLGIKIK